MTADWLNDIQENLMVLLAAVGITPSKGDSSQLLSALKGRLLNVQVFLASGTYTPTPGMKSVEFEVRGGGGGAGGAQSASSTQFGIAGGAGGGALAIGKFLAAAIGSSRLYR